MIDSIISLARSGVAGRGLQHDWRGGPPPVLALLALLLLTCGCQESTEGPQTYPVRGRIEFERGGDVKRLADRQGIIQFQSVDQPDVYAVGEINEDGSFSLATLKGTEGWEGAIAGKHRGRLDLDEQLRSLVAPKFLDYHKSGIEINVPTDSELVVKISK